MRDETVDKQFQKIYGKEKVCRDDVLVKTLNYKEETEGC